MPVKKIAIYVFIIIIMLGGTGFMLYQNQKLVAKKPVTIDHQAQPQNTPETKAPAPAESALENNQPLAENKTADQPVDVNKIKNNGIDLTIFNSDKFKELRENILIPKEQPDVGKRDPFKPN